MNDNALVSVIIPVYNKVYALEHTLQSIQNQDYSAFEVLLIDDGSIDESAAICDEFQKEDSRFIAIHKTNGGVSSARNCGLEIMKGKYVFFCDADDELPSDALALLVAAQEKSKAELVIGGFAYKNIRTGNIASPYSLNRTEMMFAVEELKDKADLLWAENNMLTSCTRLYLSEIVKKNRIKFNEELIVLEDFDFVLSYLQYVNRIHNIREYTYYQILGYGVDSYRASVDYIDNIKTVYEKFIRFLYKQSIMKTETVMKEINLVIADDLKRIATMIPKGFSEVIKRKVRSNTILSYDCVQQALSGVSWDNNTRHLIDNYGIKNWLSGLAIQKKNIIDDLDSVKVEKGRLISTLWKWKSLIRIYI